MSILHRRPSLVGRFLSVGALLAGASFASAGEAIVIDCRIALHEATVAHDELVLELELARSELAAAEEIFVLLDGLWKSDAVERLLYLGGKHERDAAKLELERRLLLVQRQQALREQYGIACGGGASDSRKFEQAHLRYRKADCAVRAKEQAIAEVDLAYAEEVLASFRDLREHDVATRQDLILSERDLEMARARVEQSAARSERCRAELDE